MYSIWLINVVKRQKKEYRSAVIEPSTCTFNGNQ